MTVGRSAGSEQGQGRTCLHCGHVFTTRADLIRRHDCPSLSVPPARDSGLSERSVTTTEDSGRDEATEPAPGLERDPDGATRVGAPIDSPLIAVHDAAGDQSGRDEAREFSQSFSAPPSRDEAQEAVARWLAIDNQAKWQYLTERSRDIYREAAAEVLSLPAVAALLRDGTTT